MLESEMDEYLEYRNHKHSDNLDSHDRKKNKKIRSNFGETEIEVSQNRESTFESKIVKKRQNGI